MWLKNQQSKVVPQLIGRELVEAIDQLILTRIAEYSYQSDDRPELIKVHKDDAEVIKRKLTDALLAMDSRKGVYVSGKPIPKSHGFDPMRNDPD